MSQPQLTPGKIWWRVITPAGGLWMETSNSEEAHDPDPDGYGIGSCPGGKLQFMETGSYTLSWENA